MVVCKLAKNNVLPNWGCPKTGVSAFVTKSSTGGGRRLVRSVTRPPPVLRTRVSFLDAFFGKSADEVDPGDVKGTKLKILKYPNPKLRAVNEEIALFDDALKQTAQEMLLIMYASDGIGLAAPQLGINKRLMVFNEEGTPEKKAKEMILANPVVIATSEEKDTKDEGCLSFPQIRGRVDRHTWIEIEYQTISGDKVKSRLEGWPARIFQHEYDHLDKVLFIDRLWEEDKTLNQKRLDKYVKKYGPGGAP